MENSSAKWYVISVFAGLEDKVVEAIKAQALKKGMLDAFEEFLVPSEQVVKQRRGSKITMNRSYFPGYILVKVRMDDEIWSMICGVPRVSGFLGAKHPQVVSESEIMRILEQVKEAEERPHNVVSFEVGEVVKVCEGPFSSFNGVIENVDEEKQRLKLSIAIFGRPTPIELEFSQVEKG
ncbi:MAG: transcription termination/antitermination protein NusG [Holosporales bacterium]|jgi:transcriptional antiterminator NusG|nr:transcription termination/antitermination protein NusG [Holosporales bacterium]